MQTRSPRVVGRDREIDHLDHLLAATRDGDGGAVFLVGEPGIGKSRLAGVATTKALDEGMATLRGRVGAIGTMVAFRPFTEALLSLVRRGEMPDTAGLGPYRQVLGRLIPDWDDGTAHDTATSTVVLGEAVLRLLALVGQGPGVPAGAGGSARLRSRDAGSDRVPARQSGGPADRIGRNAALGDLCSARAGQTVRTTRNGRPDRAVNRWTGPRWASWPPAVSRCPRAAYPTRWSTSCGMTAPESLSSSRNCCRRRAGPGSCCPGRTGASRSSTGCRRTSRQPLSGASAAGPISSDQQSRDLLVLAAVIGHRFPFSVVRKATGTDERLLLATLRAGLAAQLVGPDEPVPDWYAFRHPLTADALLAGLTPTERSTLAATLCGCDRGAAPRAAGRVVPDGR